MNTFLAVGLVVLLLLVVAWYVRRRERARIAHMMSRGTLVYVYSPTCGHCKRMAAAWDRAAAELGDMDIDAVAIDGRCIDWRSGVPHVAWVPGVGVDGGARGSIVVYSGDRTAESLVAFARAHARGRVSP